MAQPARQQIINEAWNAAQRHGLPPSWFLGMIQAESNFDIDAGSPAGAQGLGQLMPGTARSLGVNPLNWRQNLEGAATYLSQQYRKYESMDLALAAYNAGPGAVDKFGGIPPYEETQNYVARVTQYEKQYRGLRAEEKGGVAEAKPPQLQPVTPSSMTAPVQLFQPSEFYLNQMAKTAAAPFAAGAQAAQPLFEAHLARSPQSAAPSSAPFTPSAITAPGNVKWEGKPLEGEQQDFINRVARAVAAHGGTSVRVTSGYRPLEYNEQIGGATKSQHTYGHALDGEAYVPGQGWIPIGTLLKDDAPKWGLRSGDQPNFWKGAPDPIHIDEG